MNTVSKKSLFADAVEMSLWEVWSAWALSLTPMDELVALEQSESFQCYPELVAMIGCPQDQIWHPEGDVWLHTKLVVAEAACVASERGLSNDERLVLVFSALCHDFGKPDTTVHQENGRITSRDHGKQGVPYVTSFLRRIDAPDWLLEQVEPLVEYHLAYASVKGEKPSKKAVRRMKKRLLPASLELWEALIEADVSGRRPLPRARPARVWLEVAVESNHA